MSEPQHTPESAVPRELEFRWQTYFQHSNEPIFLLSSRRRILFVNQAWEALTGLSAAQAKGLACTRASRASADSREQLLSHAFCPPAEVLRQGKYARRRCLIPEPDGTHSWWDV